MKFFIIAAWQSRIAAKPVQGVVGFLIAAFIWFAIPVTISTTTGLAYLATASQNATNMLSAEDIDRGKTTVVPTKSDRDVIFCLQVLSKI